MTEQDTQLSHITLSEIVDLSYIKTPNGSLYHCITTTADFQLYKDDTLIDVHPFAKNNETPWEVQSHVYSLQNCIVFIKYCKVELWKVQDDALVKIHERKVNASLDCEYHFQEILDSFNSSIKSVCLIEYTKNFFRIFQICFDYEKDESFIVFQQTLLVGGEIDDICVFPVDTSSLDFATCAVRVENSITILTISMTYISNANSYMLETELIDRVLDLKLDYKLDGGDPITFKNLPKFDDNKLMNKKIWVLNYREIIMGSYYLNLNLIYSGELPRHIDDLRIINSFSKYRCIYPLSRELQSSFLSMIEVENDLINTDCCLVHHANSMVSLMFYNNSAFNARDPYFINLTYVKDIKLLKFFKDPIFENFKLLLYVGNKVRSGAMNDMSKVFTKSSRLDLSVPSKNGDAGKRKNKIRTYVNLEELVTLIEVFNYSNDRLYPCEQPVELGGDYKKIKIVNENNTRPSNEYMLAVKSHVKDKVFLTRIFDNTKYQIIREGFKFIESLGGYLYLEIVDINTKIVANLKLLINDEKRWVSKVLVPKFNKKLNAKFHDIHKITIAFMPNLLDSSEVTGLLSYINEDDEIECVHFSVNDDGTVKTTYNIFIGCEEAYNEDTRHYQMHSEQKEGIPKTRIYPGSHHLKQSVDNMVLLMTPKVFNSDIDVFWIITPKHVQVIMIDKINKQELKYWSQEKLKEEYKLIKWMDPTRWNLSSQGEVCIFSDGEGLQVLEVSEEIFFDFNALYEIHMTVDFQPFQQALMMKSVDLEYNKTSLIRVCIESGELKLWPLYLPDIHPRCTLSPIDDSLVIDAENEKIVSLEIMDTGVIKKQDNKTIRNFKVVVKLVNDIAKTGTIAYYNLEMSYS